MCVAGEERKHMLFPEESSHPDSLCILPHPYFKRLGEQKHTNGEKSVKSCIIYVLLFCWKRCENTKNWKTEQLSYNESHLRKTHKGIQM